MSEIESVKEYIESADALMSNKAFQKNIKVMYEGSKKQAYDKHKAITTEEKDQLKTLIEVEKTLKVDMVGWRNKTLADEIKSGHEGISAVPDIPGIKFREYWHYELEDVSAVPAKFLIVDDKAIKEFARSTRGNIDVAGIKFIKKTELASS